MADGPLFEREAVKQPVAWLPSIYRALAAHLSEVVLLIDRDGTTVASLGPSPGPLGYDADDRHGVHVAERVHPDDLPMALELLDRARRHDDVEHRVVVRARHRDGSWRRLEVVSFSRIRDPHLAAGVIRVRDITEQETGANGSAEPARFVSLAEALPVGVLSADPRGFLVFANEIAAHALLPSNPRFEHLRGDRWLQCVHETDRAGVAAALREVRAARTQARVTFDRAGDVEGSLELLVTPLLEADRCVGWVATLEDVTARLANERSLAFRATHDALTGLPNRWLLMDRLQQSLAQLERRKGGVAVVFIDLDGLKAHNDAHGHAAGDAVLIDVARRLQADLRASDTAARIGGDEFVVVTETQDRDDAVTLAERVRAMLTYWLPYGSVELGVTASVGLAYADSAQIGAEALMGRADVAMYESRRNQRA